MIYKGVTEFREEAYIRIKHKTGAEIAVEKWNRRAGEQNDN